MNAYALLDEIVMESAGSDTVEMEVMDETDLYPLSPFSMSLYYSSIPELDIE